VNRTETIRSRGTGRHVPAVRRHPEGRRSVRHRRDDRTARRRAVTSATATA